MDRHGATKNEEPLSNLEFGWEFQPLGNREDRDLILEQVQDDLERVLPTYSENVYGYGKQVARLAQLTNIADQLEPKNKQKNATTGVSVLGKATYQLAKYLEVYLSSQVSDGLLFDFKMSGLVSNNGLHDNSNNAVTDYLPYEYDPKALQQFFRKRPRSVLTRVFQVTSIGGGFALQLALGQSTATHRQKKTRLGGSTGGTAPQLRDIITSLGHFPIKIGQALSIRPDSMSQR